MRKTLLFSALILTILSGNVYAQKTKTENDYNLKKAYEVMNEENDIAKGLELLNKQLQETPDNVEALIFRMRLLRRQGQFGQALQDINHALKVNKPKKTNIKNSTIYWWKAYVYQDILDMDNAVASMKKAYELAQKDNRDVL